MWLAGTSPSSTFGFEPEVRMDCCARMFLCARCRDQVLVCSDCDRGQRYCTRACSSLARRSARRDAARRYQMSRGGRIVHAARSRRWRIRHHRVGPATSNDGGVHEGGANIVTHQGSNGELMDAPLAVCNSLSTAQSVAADALATQIKALGRGGRCRRCGAALAPRVRQGFLRRAAGVRAPRHDHRP